MFLWYTKCEITFIYSNYNLMKKTFITLFVASFMVAGPAYAQMGMTRTAGQGEEAYAQLDQDPKINVALQQLYKSQGVTSRNQVDCSKVLDDDFIALGDAVMGYGITEEEHSAMENMMGGEEAPMSKQSHTNMGRAYLGCWASYRSGPMMMPIMMGSYSESPLRQATVVTDGRPIGTQGMMGQGDYLGQGMMGGYGGLGLVSMILIWALLILGIVALIKWIKKS